MNLKRFDFKQFMLEKGERVGLGIAGAIALLLIVTGLFLPPHGFFSGSPMVKAGDLEGITTKVKGDMARATPTDADKPPPNAKDRLIFLDTQQIESASYQVAALFVPTTGEAAKRRPPEVLLPEEAVAMGTRVPLDLYIITPGDDADGPRITVLDSPAKTTAGGDKKGPPGTGGQSGANLSQGFNLGGGKPGAGNLPGGGKGRGSGAFGPSGNISTLDPLKTTFTLKTIPLKNLSHETQVTPARKLQPLRMAIITGSFPYRKQLEIFRDAMRLKTAQEVLNETVEVDRDGKRVQLPAFRFLGVDLERREVDTAGQPTSEWAPIDLQETYKPWVFAAGKRFEPDAAKLRPVSPTGLVMPRLLQFRAKHDQNAADSDKVDFENHYLNIEEQLPKLSATLENLKSKGPAEETASLPKDFTTEGLNVFDPDAGSGVGEKPRAGPGVGPGGDEGMGGRGAGLRPGGGRQPTGTPGPSSGNAIPEYCLLRVIDVNIEPGKIYAYRMRVKMGNPNENRPDVASPDFAKEPELPPTKWFEVPERVSLPSELIYYAVDQKELGDNYDGTAKDVRIDAAKSTVLQIHRYLDQTLVAGMNERKPVAIGEWAVAERVIAHRGEYVDKVENVQMPVWNYTHNTFVLPADTHGKKANRSTIRISFSHNLRDNLETILVDFEGGKQVFKMPTEEEAEAAKLPPKGLEDVAPTDVLLLTPEGRLVCRNSAADARDPERLKSRDNVRKRVESVKKAQLPTDKSGKPAGPFGPGGGGSGTPERPGGG